MGPVGSGILIGYPSYYKRYLSKTETRYNRPNLQNILSFDPEPIWIFLLPASL